LLKHRVVIGFILSLLFLSICMSPSGRILLTLPDEQRMVVGERNIINMDLPGYLEDSLGIQLMPSAQSVMATAQDSIVSITRNRGGYEIAALKPGKVDLELRILGFIPVKSITVESVANKRVVPGGHSIGVMLQSKGIMVVGFAPIQINADKKVYPARDQGVQIGDIIMEVNGKELKSETDLAAVVDASKNKPLKLKIKRDKEYISKTITAELCKETQRYRIGLYVRDGVVGVGTLTFWDAETRKYAALGHIIMDADTKQGIDVLKGKIVSSSIQTIKAGKPGKPGEKIGVFDNTGNIAGNIEQNSTFGIYGEITADIKNELNNYTMEVGYAHQVKEGPAEIYTVVNGTNIEKFDIQIEKVYPERKNGKGMVIRVTDPRLINLTGGIIQGMSGSPIIQDSRIVGAVTHVFLNDPQQGYGVFMDQILSEMPSQEAMAS
jgi:stage IV sporulation protein B